METGKVFMKKILLLLLIIAPFAYASEKVYPQTFTAKILSIYDGDTMTVTIDGLPDVFGKEIPIRIYGIDTAEIKSQNKIEALIARSLVESMCPIGSKVKLSNIRRDKYFRLDADVDCGGKDVAKELLKNGMAKPYFGGKKE